MEATGNPPPADPTRPWSPDQKVVLSEAAAYFGVPESRFDRWRKEGRIPFLQPTVKTILYVAQDLYDFEKASRVEARPKSSAKRKPKSPEHRRAISEGQRAAWARRKAPPKSKGEAS